MTADIGVVGLAVMGQNLVLNMSDCGYAVAVHNRTEQVTQDFLARHAAGRAICGCDTLEALVARLVHPRRVMLMVKAGPPVDACIESLLPLLDAGDIIIDGGNSNYLDTVRRASLVESQGMLFVGTGVSGGEEGARHGPSIMPGGSPDAWPCVQDLLQAIAAKVDDGAPCCLWLGTDGAGHFVKMVHNGIEYGDMQIISEAYLVMRELLGMRNETMSQVFDRWNEGPLNSYLIEITRDILAYRDDKGCAAIDQILDSAGQKGTGKWTAVASLEHGIPLTLIGEAVFARFLSALKNERHQAERTYGLPQVALPESNATILLRALENAVYAAKILSYTQGFMLLSAASKAHGWKLDLGDIALLWRGGCIIRSRFLHHIKTAFGANPALANLLLAPYFQQAMRAAEADFRHVVATTVSHGIPVPALSSALAFFDGYRRSLGGANLIQAQRDYFGAHTYERRDRGRGEFYHTNWTGTGGAATAGSYTA